MDSPIKLFFDTKYRMELHKYTFSLGKHRDHHVIWIKFKFSLELEENLKRNFPSVKWSSKQKSWYLPDLRPIREKLNIQLDEIGRKAILKIHPINQEPYIKMSEVLSLKAYSDNTKRTYLSEFSHLLIILSDYSINELTSEKLRDYFFYCVKKLKMKERKMNGKMNAVKFYFEQVLDKPKMFSEIPRPKRSLTFPKTLSKKEIKKVFEQAKNTKHLLAIKLCYGMGLKVSELENLKLEHINRDKMQVLIQGAKGKKDRYVLLLESILPLLTAYLKEYLPKVWLFEGPHGNAYSKSSFQKILKNVMKMAGIKKTIGIHGVRDYSYATHLLESGADLGFIRDLLRHNSKKRT